MPVRQPRMVTIAGPWRGIEERDNHRKEDQCEIALNCNFADGNIEARKGFRRINSSGRARWHLHGVHKNGKLQYIIGVGPDFQTDDVEFRSWSAAGTNHGSIAVLDAETYSLDWKCSFVDVVIPVRDVATGLRTIPHRVTLIVTPATTYIFDADGDPGVIRRVVMDDDAIQENSVNISYWKHAPLGPISTTYRDHVVYAGFAPATGIRLTSVLDEEQNQVPEYIINDAQRGHYQLGPQWLAMSDRWDPVGVRSDYIWRVNDREAITGLANYMETLIVFTNDSVYAGTGAGETFALRPIVRGVGCVAPGSVVEVAGTLYWMSRDGVYAFQGGGPGGGAVKLTKPIDSLFSGRTGPTHLPEQIADYLTEEGWPFQVNHDEMHLCQALHVQSLNQIWWCLPIKGKGKLAFSLTLVLDYAHMGWSYFLPHSSSLIGTCMYSGVTFPEGNKETIITANTAGKLFRYGWYMDGVSGGTTRGVPMIYMTGRLLADKDAFGTLGTVRLKMLSAGKTPADNPPRWFIDGEESHHDAYVNNVAQTAAERQEQSGELRLHPGSDNEDGETDNTYFWDETTWNGSKWTARDWWSNEIESNTCRSRSFRIGVEDNPKATDRPSLLKIQAFTLSYSREDER